MSSLLLESRLPDVSHERETDSTLIVAWQNSESREISPAGLLEHDPLGYALRDESAQDALSALRDGDSVELHPQPDNPVDRLAIHLCSGDIPIGWVPRKVYAGKPVDRCGARQAFAIPSLGRI